MKNLNWAVHRQDPDNWIRIPEFGVLPESVNFEGFSVPILGPSAEEFSWRVPVYEAVRSVRDEGRQRFSSMRDLRSALAEALDSDELMLDAHGFEFARRN